MARRIAPNAGLSAPRERHKDVSHTATKAKSANPLRPISGRFNWNRMYSCPPPLSESVSACSRAVTILTELAMFNRRSSESFEGIIPAKLSRGNTGSELAVGKAAHHCALHACRRAARAVGRCSTR